MSGLYVHVPFCVSKCQYCDFYSERIKANNVNLFLKGLALEVKLFSEMLLKEALMPRTLYLGGGTPSVLTAEQLKDMLQIINNVFVLDQAEEITVEVNPGTITKDKLILYGQLGINRISIGVQSFDDQDLIAMGRKHRLDQTMELIAWINELQFPNYSVDLIYGLPAQSLEGWEKNLVKAISCRPNHISLYGLKIEEKTPWGQLCQEGKLTVPDDSHQADMYQMAVTKLAQGGYHRYEISNFAQKGYESKHNLLYWHNKTYLGLGPGASSYYQQKRWSNIADLDDYALQLEEEKLPIAFGEEISQAVREAETIFLNLRLAEGIKIAEFDKKFGIDFMTKYKNQLARFIEQGLLEIDDSRVKLTNEGVLLANEVFVEFLPNEQANYLDKR